MLKVAQLRPYKTDSEEIEKDNNLIGAKSPHAD